MIPAAPLRRRLAAFVYEGVLLFGVLMGAGLVFGVLTQQRHALEGRHALQVFVFLVLGAYFVGLWTHGGQTLAMRTWRIRLVDTANRPVDLRRALVRYLATWVWFVPPLLIEWLAGWHDARSTYLVVGVWVLGYALSSRLHPDRQFWHDHWAGTRLLDARKEVPAPAQSRA